MESHHIWLEFRGPPFYYWSPQLLLLLVAGVYREQLFGKVLCVGSSTWSYYSLVDSGATENFMCLNFFTCKMRVITAFCTSVMYVPKSGLHTVVKWKQMRFQSDIKKPLIKMVMGRGQMRKYCFYPLEEIINSRLHKMVQLFVCHQERA